MKYHEPAFILSLWNEINVARDLQQLKVRLAPPTGGCLHWERASLIPPQALLPKPHQRAPPRLHFDWWWSERQQETQEDRRSAPCGTRLGLPRQCVGQGTNPGNNIKDSFSYLFGLSKAIQIASSVTSSSLHKHNANHQRALFNFFLLFFLLDLLASEGALSGNCIPGGRSSSRRTLLVKGTVHVQMLLPSPTNTWQECKMTACLLLPPPGRFCDSRWLSVSKRTRKVMILVFRKSGNVDDGTRKRWIHFSDVPDYIQEHFKGFFIIVRFSLPFSASDQGSKAKGLLIIKQSTVLHNLVFL